MASEYSFDIVSEADMQLIANTLNVTRKEIATRYDFRGSTAEIAQDDMKLNFKAEDDYKIGAMLDMFKQKAIKQGIDLKFFDFGEKVEDSLGGNVKQLVTIKKGIDKEKAKEINVFIKGLGVKANSQIQAEVIRVFSKDKDALQKVMQSVRSADFGVALSFTNFR